MNFEKSDAWIIVFASSVGVLIGALVDVEDAADDLVGVEDFDEEVPR